MKILASLAGIIVLVAIVRTLQVNAQHAGAVEAAIEQRFTGIEGRAQDAHLVQTQLLSLIAAATEDLNKLADRVGSTETNIDTVIANLNKLARHVDGMSVKLEREFQSQRYVTALLFKESDRLAAASLFHDEALTNILARYPIARGEMQELVSRTMERTLKRVEHWATNMPPAPRNGDSSESSDRPER